LTIAWNVTAYDDRRCGNRYATTPNADLRCVQRTGCCRVRKISPPRVISDRGWYRPPSSRRCRCWSSTIAVCANCRTRAAKDLLQLIMRRERRRHCLAGAFKSQAPRRKFAQLLVEGKISPQSRSGTAKPAASGCPIMWSGRRRERQRLRSAKCRRSVDNESVAKALTGIWAPRASTWTKHPSSANPSCQRKKTWGGDDEDAISGCGTDRIANNVYTHAFGW